LDWLILVKTKERMTMSWMMHQKTKKTKRYAQRWRTIQLGILVMRLRREMILLLESEVRREESPWKTRVQRREHSKCCKFGP
jgi:hypothetical protein